MNDQTCCQEPRLTQVSKDKTPLGVEYETQGLEPANLALVPILRSGLGMVEGMLCSLTIYHISCHMDMLSIYDIQQHCSALPLPPQTEHQLT